MFVNTSNVTPPVAAVSTAFNVKFLPTFGCEKTVSAVPVVPLPPPKRFTVPPASATNNLLPAAAAARTLPDSPVSGVDHASRPR